MRHLHSAVDVKPDQTVEVTLAGSTANVMLLDDENYALYQKGESFQYTGGHATKSPVALRPPKPGHWNVVVDLGGNPAGQVNATISVRAI